MSVEVGLTLFTLIQNCYKYFQFDLKKKPTENDKLYPILLFSNFTMSLAKSINFENLLDWESENESLKCFIFIFDCLVSQIYKPNRSTAVDILAEWRRTLKEFLNSVFKTTQDKINFFVNFYSTHDCQHIPKYNIIRLFGIKMFDSLLKKENDFEINKDHVYKIILGLSSKYECFRTKTLETLEFIVKCHKVEDYLNEFIENVLEARNEITMDAEQFALILFTVLNAQANDRKEKTQMPKRVLRELLILLSSADTIRDLRLKSQLLQVLKHINNESILSSLIPLGIAVIENSEEHKSIKILGEPFSDIFQMIFVRFDQHVVENIFTKSPKTWELFESVFAKYNTFIERNDKLVPVPSIALELLDENTFNYLPAEYQIRFIKLIIKTVSISDNDEIFLDANKLLRKCSIDCEPLIDVFLQMSATSILNKPPGSSMKAKRTKNQMKKEQESFIYNIDKDCPEWKQGLILIELLENKKGLQNPSTLIPPLFDLLKICVSIDEEQNLEYVKQITMSLILHCCKVIEYDGFELQKIKSCQAFKVQYIVKCLRSSHNPQTHNNALLLLSHCANIVPREVLTEIVAIFTFMGSSVVRKDDAFSFHIINNIITSIIPILVKQDDQISEPLVIPVLKVFSDIMLDVPEHRRLLLYTKLFETLGAEKYLWMFLCVVFETHVLKSEKERKAEEKHASKRKTHQFEKINKRMEISLQIVNEFEPKIIIETCVQLLTYFEKLPVEKTTENNENPSESKDKTQEDAMAVDVDVDNATDEHLFNTNERTAKELRHYIYLILQFLTNMSCSPKFLQKINQLSEANTLAMKPYFQNFIIKTLSCLPFVNKALEKSELKTRNNFWQIILNNLHDVLDNAISLLSADMFLLVISGLMEHQLLSIRRKVIELLISKLQSDGESITNCNLEHFQNLLGLLTKTINEMLEKCGQPITNEMQQVQQTTLIALRLLSKRFSAQYAEEFKTLLGTLTKILKKKTKLPKVLYVSALLTLIEISSQLRAKALAYLPQYMSSLIDTLSDLADFLQTHPPDNTATAIIVGKSFFSHY